ncbi:hypothetical protein JCM10207_000165 [Rhodosporidiobolus poonsookiae]
MHRSLPSVLVLSLLGRTLAWPLPIIVHDLPSTLSSSSLADTLLDLDEWQYLNGGGHAGVLDVVDDIERGIEIEWTAEPGAEEQWSRESEAEEVAEEMLSMALDAREMGFEGEEERMLRRLFPLSQEND